MLKWDSTRNTRGFVARTLQIASLAGKESTEAPCNYTPMKFNMDPQVLVWEDTFLLGTVLTSSYNWNSIAWFRNAKIRSDSTYPESIILCWHETQIFERESSEVVPLNQPTAGFRTCFIHWTAVSWPHGLSFLIHILPTLVGFTVLPCLIELDYGEIERNPLTFNGQNPFQPHICPQINPLMVERPFLAA